MRRLLFAFGCFFPLAGASNEELTSFAKFIHAKTTLISHGVTDDDAADKVHKYRNDNVNAYINTDNDNENEKPFAMIPTSNPKHETRSRKLLNSSGEASSVALHKEGQDNDSTDKRAYTCDVQFMECFDHPKCISCFKDMDTNGIDWSIVAPNAPCNDVLDALIVKAGYCTNLGINQSKDLPERNTFCRTFDACVIWKDSDDDVSDVDDKTNNNGNGNGNPKKKKKYSTDTDCDSLTSCAWDGMKPSFLGDGICHDFIDGCYNTAICNYDNGDCCADTCKNSTNIGPPCGSDGYFCKDPKSEFVKANADDDDNAWNGSEKNGNDNRNKDKPMIANCTVDETPYKMFQYDSFGDGWDRTEMTITHREDSFHVPLYDGKLKNGAEGMEYLCLSTKPACYQVKLHGGSWGNMVSWEIKPMKNGAPAMASGGAPMDCEFPVSGALCTNTCLGGANLDPAQDEKYHTYHKMEKCITDKCIIQLGMCEHDLVCNSCIGDTTLAYCLANDLFNALGFCTECNCVEGDDHDHHQKKRFCQEKSKEKHENDNEDGSDENTPNHPDSNTSKRVRACGFDEFMDGSKAVIQYSECSQIDTISALMTDFDPDNFGMLDAFESCASKYTESSYGISALDCLRILENAVVHPGKSAGVDPTKNVPFRAISALANDLLNDGENFCDCSTKASEAAPVCQDFIHFKTLLYESLDGCRSLDAIDCGAWAEFSIPCKANLLDKFEKADFSTKAQCQYAQDRCGNVGPFPSFRRLDCGEEISEDAWDMYLEYERNCLRDGQGPTPKAPTKPISVSTQSPTVNRDRKPYNPSPDDKKQNVVPVPSNTKPETKKKYVPPEKRGKDGVGRSHKFLRNFVIFCLLAGGAYWYFKNRYGLFDYNQFRRARNYGYDNTDMYDSLTMQNNQATFEPPTLPPPPTAYYDNEGGNAHSFPMSNMSTGENGGFQ